MPPEGDSTITSVERTFDILEQLKQHGKTGVTELAENVDMPPSTVYNYLRTLEQRQYIRKDGNQYEIADRFVHFGDFARMRHPLYRTGRPNIVWLAEETGKTVNLMIEEYGRGIYLTAANRERHLRNFAHERQREYLHTTAAGKSILASMTDAEVAEVIEAQGLPARTENSITEKDELLSELSRIRDRGYAINDEENTSGIRAVGAPIENPDGPDAAVSLSALAGRCSIDELEEDLAPQVRDTVEAISLELRS
jgi:IclR family acetate operon transcriptional repressor